MLKIQQFSQESADVFLMLFLIIRTVNRKLDAIVIQTEKTVGRMKQQVRKYHAATFTKPTQRRSYLYGKYASAY